MTEREDGTLTHCTLKRVHWTKDREIMCYTFYGWRGGAMARRLTYDEEVASSIPDQGAAA